MTFGKHGVVERVRANFALMHGFMPGSTYLGFDCAHRGQLDEMQVDEHLRAFIAHPDAVTTVWTVVADTSYLDA